MAFRAFGGQGLQNRRRTERASGTNAGRIFFGWAEFQCAVLDLSEVGARVHLARAATLPALLILELPDRSTRIARVRWHVGPEAGLEFVTGPAANDTGEACERI